MTRREGAYIVSSPALPFIECEQLHAGLAVNDIPTAVDFYIKKLGFQQAFTWGEPPTFAGVNFAKSSCSWGRAGPLPVLRLATDAPAVRVALER
jgi:catechol 2,3-dioxygenase-like lactoylglutathione lyase family enzyme